MRSPALLLLALPTLLLAGCLDGPIGNYELGSATVATSCSGVDSTRASAWSDALNANPASDLEVGRASSSDPPVAMLFRDDASLFFTQLIQDPADQYLWTGSREVGETTVAEAKLGSDYSALLEADGQCTFDLIVDAELAFQDSSWDRLTATFVITVDEADGGDPCDLTSCSAELAFGASHSDGLNPGIQPTE